MPGDPRIVARPVPSGPMRLLLMTVGFICTGIGITGLVVPGLPGVPFLLVAAWAFSRSSKRFHRWLIYHPIFGEPVRAWQQYRAVPKKAKIAAVLVMTSSFLLLLWLQGPDSFVPWVAGGCMVVVAIWLVTRPDLDEARARARALAASAGNGRKQEQTDD